MNGCIKNEKIQRMQTWRQNIWGYMHHGCSNNFLNHKVSVELKTLQACLHSSEGCAFMWLKLKGKNKKYCSLKPFEEKTQAHIYKKAHSLILTSMWPVTLLAVCFLLLFCLKRQHFITVFTSNKSHLQRWSQIRKWPSNNETTFSAPNCCGG